MESVEADNSDADAEDFLADLRSATSEMDELQVSTGSRILLITPTLKGVLDDFSQTNPAQQPHAHVLLAHCEVPHVRFYTVIDLLSGDEDQFGYQRAAGECVATENGTVVPGKTYYALSGGTYSSVASTSVGSLTSYYELVGAGADRYRVFSARGGVQALLCVPRCRVPLVPDGTMGVRAHTRSRACLRFSLGPVRCLIYPQPQTSTRHTPRRRERHPSAPLHPLTPSPNPTPAQYPMPLM